MIKFRILLRLLNYFYEFTQVFFSLKIEIGLEAQLSVSSGPVQRFSSRIFYPMDKSKDYCKADSEQRVLFFHTDISAGRTSLLQVYRC